MKNVEHRSRNESGPRDSSNMVNRRAVKGPGDGPDSTAAPSSSSTTKSSFTYHGDFYIIRAILF